MIDETVLQFSPILTVPSLDYCLDFVFIVVVVTLINFILEITYDFEKVRGEGVQDGGHCLPDGSPLE